MSTSRAAKRRQVRRNFEGVPAIGYARVSTGEQTLSIDAQINSITEWGREKGVASLVIYKDVGVSGGLPLVQRSKLVRALNSLTPQAVLIVTAADRLSRDMYEMGAIRYEVTRRKASVVLTSGDDLFNEDDSPEQVLLTQVMASVAQWELAKIRERTIAALDAKRARGEKLGGITPYGFRKARQAGVLKLIPVQAELDTLSSMAQLYADGWSYPDVARWANQNGTKPRRSLFWTDSLVRHALDAYRRRLDKITQLTENVEQIALTSAEKEC